MEMNWLPIGSVVLLKGGQKPVMICGRIQRQREVEKVWDYSACLYPEGMISADEMILFNREQVDKLLFIGFQTESEYFIAEKLNGLLEEANLSLVKTESVENE